MIILEPNHPVIEETVLLKLRNARDNPNAKPETIGLTIADFDGVQYRITNPVSLQPASSAASSADQSEEGGDSAKSVAKHKEHPDRTKINISIQLGCFRELRESGNADAYLKSVYGPLLLASPDKGFDVTVQLDLTASECQDETRAGDLAKSVSLIKRNCFAALFTTFFDHQAEMANQMSKKPGSKSSVAQSPANDVKRAVVHYRHDECLFIEARYDRVTVIFSLSFRDEDDMVIGKIFLQEFKEGRRASATAPQILFSRDQPAGFQEYLITPASSNGGNGMANDSEVSSLASSSSNQTDVVSGYITFVFFPRHTTGQDVRENTIDLIHTFRNYLHYHIKCSKAYMHSRMRAKTSEFLKVLNRAKPDAVARGSISCLPQSVAAGIQH